MGVERDPNRRQSPGHAVAVARLARHLEVVLAEADLSLPQYRLLWLLASGSSAPSKLAAKLAVSPPSVTAVVDGLVARGLVARTADDVDRRRVVHLLTARGRKALRDADAAAEDRLAAIASMLDDPGQTLQAVGGLELWRDALDAWRSSKAGDTPPPPVARTRGGAPR